MTVRELLEALSEHAEDGRLLDDEVMIRVGSELRRLQTSYVDGTFVIVAGMPV